jgi:LysM repeat protein
MGEDRTSLAWEGYLVGEDAYRLAIALEKLKDAGQTVQLLIEGYPELCKPVRVERFPWRLVRRDLVEYSIELVAVIPPPKVAVPTQSGAQTQGGGSQTQVAGSQAGAARTEYTVRSGDTLWAVAQRFLGAGQRWREIAAANGILDPRRLAVGTRLVIPA